MRETWEETGVEITLLPPPLPAPRLPAGFPHRVLPRSWWTVSGRTSADSVTPGPHVHIDQQLIALATGTAHPDRESEPIWLSAPEFERREDCLPDTKMHALDLLAALDHVGAPDAPDALARALFLALGGA